MDLLILETNELTLFNILNAIYKEGWEQRVLTDYASFNAVVIRTTAVIN
jgi:hypothetical protein